MFFFLVPVVIIFATLSPMFTLAARASRFMMSWSL